LEPGEHHPAGLPDLPLVCLALPVADRPDALAGRRLDDLEHLRRPVAVLTQVAAVSLLDLLRALGPAEVLHHRRVAEEPVQKREVVLAPRHDPVLGLAQSISFRSIAWIAIRHMISAKTTSIP